MNPKPSGPAAPAGTPTQAESSTAHAATTSPIPPTIPSTAAATIDVEVQEKVTPSPTPLMIHAEMPVHVIQQQTSNIPEQTGQDGAVEENEDDLAVEENEEDLAVEENEEDLAVEEKEDYFSLVLQVGKRKDDEFLDTHVLYEEAEWEFVQKAWNILPAVFEFPVEGK